MNPLIPCLFLLISSAFPTTLAEIFKNSKDEYFFFNGNEIKLNYKETVSLCRSIGGTLPDLTSHDHLFILALRDLSKSLPIWLGVTRTADGPWVTEDGAKVSIGAEVECSSLASGGTCALILRQQLLALDVKQKALQVCKLDKETIASLRENLETMNADVAGLAMKEDALQSEQERLKADADLIKRKVETVMKQLNESRGSASDPSPDVWHPLDRLRELMEKQREIQKSSERTKEDVSEIQSWREVISHNLVLVNEAVEGIPSLESNVKFTSEMVDAIAHNSLPRMEEKVNLLDLTLRSLMQDVQEVKNENDKQVNELKSYIDAARINMTSDSMTRPEALASLMKEIREEMRKQKEESDTEIGILRQEQDELSVKTAAIEKNVSEMTEKMKFMVTEWRSVLDRILQPSSSTRRAFMSRIKRLAA